MVRPKKAARASRANGALAKNKGKAKEKVRVVDYAEIDKGVVKVDTTLRPKLPKGYVAYASEVDALRDVLLHREEQARVQTPMGKGKGSISLYEGRQLRVETANKALELAARGKDLGLNSRIAKLKAEVKGMKFEVDGKRRVAFA